MAPLRFSAPWLVPWLSEPVSLTVNRNCAPSSPTPGTGLGDSWSALQWAGDTNLASRTSDCEVDVKNRKSGDRDAHGRTESSPCLQGPRYTQQVSAASLQGAIWLEMHLGTRPHISSRETRERPCLCPFWRMNNTFPVAAPWAKGRYVVTPTLVPGKKHGIQGRNLVTAGFWEQGWEGKAIRWANHRVCALMQITSSLAYSHLHPSPVSPLIWPPLALGRGHYQLGTLRRMNGAIPL